MAIGVSRDEFYHSTMSELRDFDEAYKLRRKIEDERDYFCGIYVYEAVQTVISNSFRDHKRHPKPVMTYRDKPILVELEEKKHLENLTEEEKKAYTDDLFAMLGQMQSAFERTHS